ncbi:MAG: prepilin-type N-terminal cleavage/methylation domain-containing protein [Amphritea sp.]
MTIRSARRDIQSGFTLLELLIALLLTGLLTVLVYGGLNVGLSTWEKVINRNEELSDAFLTQRFLRRLLEAADPQLVVEDIDHVQSSVGFLGLENELLFIAPLPRFEGGGEALWIYLSVGQNEDEVAQLQMATTPYDPNQPVDWELLLAEFRSEQESDRYVLATGDVEQIQFQYLEIEEDGFSRWQPEWRFETTTPAAIQMRFMSENTLVRGWPDLVVTPREYAYGIKNAR